MTITWVNNVPNPAGQTGDDYKVLLVSDGDGVSSVSIGSLPHSNDGAMVFSIWWKAVTATTATVTALGETKVGSITTDWSRFYVAIPTPTGSTINIVPANGSSDIYMAMAQLEMGEVPSDWRESQDEFATKTELNIVDGKVETVVETVDSVVRETSTPGRYEVYVGGSSGNSLVALDNNDNTIMQITKNGFAVNSGNATVMQISPESFTVINNAATDPDDQTTMEITPTSFRVNTELVEFNVPNESLRIDGDGASMDHLTVNEELMAPNMVYRYTGPTTIHVGTNLANASLQDVLNTLSGKMLYDDVLIWIDSDLYEQVTLSGVHGIGTISIDGSGNYRLYGTLTLQDCRASITLGGLTVIYTVDATSGSNWGNAITIRDCNFVKLELIVTHGSSSAEAGVSVKTSKVYMTSCEIYDTDTCIEAYQLSYLGCSNIIGGKTNGKFLVGALSTIVWKLKRPLGSFYEDEPCVVKCDGTDPLNLETVSYSGGSGGSVTPPTVYEKTLYATASGAYYGSGWNESTDEDANRGNHLYQGAYGSLQYAGCMWFDTSTIPQTATVKSVSLTIKRYSGAGGSSPVAVNMAYTPLSGKTGNPHTGAGQSSALTSSIANGEIQTISTSGLLSAVSSIVTNRAGGLMFYTNESTPSGKKCSRNYARFDGVNDPVVPTLTITYEA